MSWSEILNLLVRRKSDLTTQDYSVEFVGGPLDGLAQRRKHADLEIKIPVCAPIIDESFSVIDGDPLTTSVAVYAREFKGRRCVYRFVRSISAEPEPSKC